MGAGRNGKLLTNRHRVSVKQDESVLENCCTTLYYSQDLQTYPITLFEGTAERIGNEELLGYPIKGKPRRSSGRKKMFRGGHKRKCKIKINK